MSRRGTKYSGGTKVSERMGANHRNQIVPPSHQFSAHSTPFTMPTGAGRVNVPICRKRGARNDSKYVETRHHSVRLSAQFFAAITYGHHTPLIHIPTRPPSERKDKKDRGGVNSEQYCKLVYFGPGGLNSWMGGLPGVKEGGNSAHRSAYTDKKRAELGVRKIPWPARSPDLNPIENVWARYNVCDRDVGHDRNWDGPRIHPKK